MSKYIDLGINEIHELLKKGEITPTVLVNECFERIEKNNLNAFITLNFTTPIETVTTKTINITKIIAVTTWLLNNKYIFSSICSFIKLLLFLTSLCEYFFQLRSKSLGIAN